MNEDDIYESAGYITLTVLSLFVGGEASKASNISKVSEVSKVEKVLKTGKTGFWDDLVNKVKGKSSSLKNKVSKGKGSYKETAPVESSKYLDEYLDENLDKYLDEINDFHEGIFDEQRLVNPEYEDYLDELAELNKVSPDDIGLEMNKSPEPEASSGHQSGSSSSKGDTNSSSILKETDKFIDYGNESGTSIRFIKQDQNAINNSIYSKMNSSTVGDVVEAKVGNFIQTSTEFELTDFANKVKTPNGATIGDIDCATKKTLIEVKNSVSSVKVKQINKYIDPTDVNYMNVENKQVVIYIEEPIDYSNIKVDAMIKYLKSKGVIVVNSLEELEGVLK